MPADMLAPVMQDSCYANNATRKQSGCLEMVKEHSVFTRYHAIGMSEAGDTQAHVAKTLGVAVRTFWNWKNHHEAGEVLENRLGPRQEKKHFKHC